MADNDMPQQLTYAFPFRRTDSGGLAYTFTLTLTREIVESAGRITAHYDVEEDPALERIQNSLGVMHCSMVEELTQGVSSLILGDDSSLYSVAQAGRALRYAHACRKAIGYDTNPRNLEAFWKPVYRSVMSAVIDKMDTCDVVEELPIWIFKDSLDALPLSKTVSMPKDGGKTVFPDLSIVLRLGTFINNHTLSYKRYLPVIVELKRAISRSLTVHGVPDPNNILATRRLLDVFTDAQEQIELAGYLQMAKVPDQSHIVLVAGVGPWFRIRPVSREELRASEIQWMTEKAIMRQIKQRASDESGDPEDPEHPDEGSAQWKSITPEPNFAVFGAELKKMSYLADWSAPVLLGSPAAEQMWVDVRTRVRKMLSSGRM